ncbi:MAG: SseB family protein [Solobacterium sp.]|nr:SseB family protein [Solobacterium sp.]
MIKGQFLAPMIAQTIKNAKGKAVGPAQLKFVLLNTNKGQSFFPLFTDAEEAH